MFNEKKELIRKLQNENDNLNRLVDYYQKSWCPKAPEINLSNDFVECEKCGCLLNKKTAFRGESTVEKTYNTIFDLTPAQEVIKENYYCKIHKPNKK